MKTRIVFLIFLLLFAMNAGAQQYRFYVGGNLSNVTSPPPGFSANSNLGYQAGADVRFGKNRFYLQPGIQYASTRISLANPLDKKSNLRVSGFKIPVMVGWSMSYSPSCSLRFFTGPSFMAITNVKHTDMNDPAYVLTDKNYHDVEWAWHLGTGLDWRFLFVDLGFQKGLTYVFTGASNGKSYMFYTNVGIRFLAMVNHKKKEH